MKPALILIALVVTLLFLPILTALFSDPPQNLFAEGTTLHAIGGVLHDPDTLANLNTRITDATLDDIGDPRTPSAHTIVSHSDTTATGAELDELTDGSTTALHLHDGGGAFTLEGTSLAEATTTSLTDVDLLTISGLNIPAAKPLLITVLYRKTAGAAATPVSAWKSMEL